MDRLFILAIACVSQIGCQSPYSPFGVQSTRVPPPPTGVIGNGNYESPSAYPPSHILHPHIRPSAYPPASSPYPPASSPYPPANSTPYDRRYSPAPSQSPIAPLPPSIGSYIPPLRGPGETITGVGPWRYWESANKNEKFATATRSAKMEEASRTAPAISSNSLTRNDRLHWTEPQETSTLVVPGSVSEPYPTVVRGNNLPPSLNNLTHSDPSHSHGATGQPTSSRPRYVPVPQQLPMHARSIPQDRVSVVPTYVDPQSEGVRQASASSYWRSSSDDRRE